MDEKPTSPPTSAEYQPFEKVVTMHIEEWKATYVHPSAIRRWNQKLSLLHIMRLETLTIDYPTRLPYRQCAADRNMVEIDQKFYDMCQRDQVYLILPSRL